MFRTGQIISKTRLLKHFNLIASHLDKYPQPLLITQKGGRYLVLVNAEIFEDITQKRLESDLGEGEESHLNDVIEEAEM